LFIGSDHYPNREAAQYICDLEAQLGPKLGVQFVIVGDAGRGICSSQHLRVTGFVDDVTDYLMAADIALNPLTNGSGTSLKAVENLACGLPTITTEVGIRGLDIVPGRDALVGTRDQFPKLIERLISDLALQHRLTRAGRQLAERKYGWRSLGQHMLAIYQGLPCVSV
jgi:glycosyltransferase involved in cell wall biosynthesis